MATDPTEHRVSPLIMGVAYLGLGLLMLLPPVFGVLGVVRLLQARETAGWPTAPAVVTRSELATTKENAKQKYVARIEFAYHLDGQQRLGTKPYRNYAPSSKASLHQNLIQQFPVGTQTKAAYNPKNPGEAYLLAGVQWGDYVLLAPWLFVLFEFYVIVRLVAKWRGSASPTNSAATQPTSSMAASEQNRSTA